MSGAGTIWMPLYVRDYIGDTQGLTMEQSGSYLHLLMASWIMGPLPDDDDRLAAICRMTVSRFRKAVKAAVMPMFKRTDEGFVQKRLEAEREKVRKNITQKSRAGKKSAEVKDLKSKETGSTAEPTARQRRVNPSPSPSPSQTPQEKKQTESTGTAQPSLGLLTVVADNPRAVGKEKTERARKGEGATAQAWAAYARAYRDRYGVEPLSNRTTLAKMAQFARSVPTDEAVPIAAHYLTLSKRFYVEAQHPVGILLKDCESIRTQWATGCSITSTRALQTDKRRAAFDAVDEAMEILDRRYAGMGV